MRKLILIIIALGILTGCENTNKPRQDDIDKTVLYERGYWTVVKLNDTVVVYISAEARQKPIVVNTNNLNKEIYGKEDKISE